MMGRDVAKTPRAVGTASPGMKQESALPATTSVGLPSATLALLTALIWAGNPVAVSYSVDSLPPVAVAGVRFAMAALFMLVWCACEGSELRIRRGQRLPVLVAGVALFAQIAVFNVGVMLSNSSHSSMMINTFVLWVVVIEHFVTRGDRITSRKLAGLLMASFGIVLLLSREFAADPVTQAGDTPTLIGDLLVLLSALILGLKIVYTKHALKRVEPGKLIFWHDVVGMVLFFAYSWLWEEVKWTGFTFPVILSLVYQGLLVAGLCFAIQALLLRRHSASQIAIFSFATPLFGVALGVLFRADPLTPWLFVAAALVAWGILLNSVKESRARKNGETGSDSRDP